MKAVIYARYSSDNQREESIEGQLRECKEYADKNGITILCSYIDRALSAKTDNRPEFQKMVQDSAKGLFDTVLVWKLDRFARNRYDSAHYKAVLRRNGVKVVSATENISDGPEGIILESMLEGMAEYYSAELAQKINRGLTENALKGKNNGGGIPLGYQLTDDQHLRIDPLTAPIVREIYQRYAEGETVRSIITSLNERHILTQKQKPFRPNSLHSVLCNRKYIGEYRYKDIIIPDGVPSIIPKDLFERVQMRVEKNKRTPARAKAEEEYLLTTKLFCGHCGGRLVLTTNGTTVRFADGTPIHKKRIRYVCYNKTRRRQECTGQTGYTMHIVDGIVTEVLHQVFNKMQGASGDMIVGSAVQKQMAMIRSELQRARAENTKANKEYESLKAEVLKAIQGKSALPQDVLSEMLEDARQKVLSSSERITELTAELNDGNSKIEEMKAEYNQIVSWSKIFDDSPMEVKKMICGYIIKKVSVCKDYDIKIEFSINVEQFLNGIDGVSECDTSELSIAQ